MRYLLFGDLAQARVFLVELHHSRMTYDYARPSTYAPFATCFGQASVDTLAKSDSFLLGDGSQDRQYSVVEDSTRV